LISPARGIHGTERKSTLFGLTAAMTIRLTVIEMVGDDHCTLAGIVRQ
jgi:hypothetical protein